MGILRRRREGSVIVSPVGPHTFVDLLAYALSDWGKTLRFVTLIGGSVGLAMVPVVLAAKGLNGAWLHYLPAGIATGGSALTFTVVVTRLFRRRSAGESRDDKQTTGH
jgi:hypothetical protein